MIKHLKTGSSIREPKLDENAAKRTLKPQIGKNSLTQSLFPSKKTSFQTNVIECSQKLTLKNFYQTLGPTLSNQWVRPESKRNSRKLYQRPQTSKGLRKRRPQQLQFNRSPFPSKSMYDGSGDEKENTPSESTNFSSITIILNSKDKRSTKKSVYCQKFRTDLPDDFLSLFAD